MADADPWLASAQQVVDGFASGEPIDASEVIDLIPDDMQAGFEADFVRLDNLYVEARSEMLEPASPELQAYMGSVQATLRSALYFCEQSEGRKTDKARGGWISEHWQMEERYNRLPEQDKKQLETIFQSDHLRDRSEEFRFLLHGCRLMYLPRTRASLMPPFIESLTRLAVDHLRAAIAREAGH